MKNIKKLFALLTAAALVLSLAACGPAEPKVPEDTTIPVVEKAIRINESDIEIYFADYYTGSKTPDTSPFVLKSADGTELAKSSTYGGSGSVFFDNILTVHLETPVTDTETVLTLEYNGDKFEVPYDAYYKYEKVAKCGVYVKGGRTLLLPEETLTRAAEMVDVLLSESQFLADKMKESGCFLAVYGPDEHAYYIPEHRGSYDPNMRYVEGFGGTTCSITESNVWHWLATTEDKPREDYYTAYWDESILAHEFSHGIKISGIDILADQSLANEYQMVYRHAKAAGLWPNSYAISNSDEFFATLTTIWFNAMNESGQNDLWDGVRGPINTRDELYNYDIDSYRFFSKIYPFTTLGEGWENVADKYILTGLATEKAVDLAEAYIFNFPADAVASAGGINYTDSFKILYNQSGHAIDANATSFGAGLWWDYASSYPDTCQPMTYTFEEVEPTKQEDGKTVFTVKIKNEANGYVTAKTGKLATDGSEATVFTIAVGGDGLATISCTDGYLYINETPADGTLVKVSADAEPGVWRVASMAPAKNIVFVHDAAANDSESGVTAAVGEVVELTAKVPEGKTFTGWKISGATLDDSASVTTSFAMPDGDVVVWALYE